MAAIQLSGSGVALRLSPSTYRVSFAAGVGLDRTRFGCLLFKIPTVGAPKLSVSMCLNGSRARTPDFEANIALKYTEDQVEQLIDEPAKSYPTEESTNRKVDMDMHVEKEGALPPKRYAKIHDFCLGIPYGGFVFVGGLVGFLFSRNPASLATGVLFGGAILAMGVISLKVWRKGVSSLPFILGQAALAATLLWKNLQLFSLTKKVFPSGFYLTMSAAMVCFYSYVLISGGNPPPKKLAAAPPS